MLRRPLLRLKRIRQRYYYHVKPKVDDRNRAAQNMDFLVLTFVFWVIVLMLLGNFFKTNMTIPVSLIIAIGGGLIAYFLRKRQRQGRNFHYKLWSAGQELRNEIKNIKTRDELAKYITLFLTQLPQFKDVHVNQKSRRKKLTVDKSVAIFAKNLKGALVAGQCIAPGASGTEEVRYIQSLHRVLQEQGLDRAFIAATAPLNPEARSLLEQLRKKYHIALLNDEKLVELSLQAKQLPETQNVGEEDIAGGKKTKYSLLNLLLSPQKKASYMFAAGTLWCIHLISHPSGFLEIINIGLIFLNLTLALACYVLNLSNESIFNLEDL